MESLFIVDSNGFKGFALSLAYRKDSKLPFKVADSGYLYNNKGEDLTFAEYKLIKPEAVIVSEALEWEASRGAFSAGRPVSVPLLSCRCRPASFCPIARRRNRADRD